MQSSIQNQASPSTHHKMQAHTNIDKRQKFFIGGDRRHVPAVRAAQDRQWLRAAPEKNEK
jgi:hypothetical protein